MTHRSLYPIAWAEGGDRKDPDLDTEHPSFIADRYQKIGWKSEKPPEEWQNFISWLTDEKMRSIMESGIPFWQATVTYPPNAVVMARDNTLLINTSGKPSLNQDPVSNAAWTLIAGMYMRSIDGYVGEFNKLYNDHMAASNPHKDTIERIGGVDVEYVDKGFGDPTDARTIVNHKGKTGRVHNETPAQVGTLPNTTGTFTGTVCFLAGLQLNAGNKLQISPSTGMIEIAQATISVAVNSNGEGYVVIGNNQYLMASEANLVSINNKLNQKYVLPLPDFSFNLEYSMHDVSSIGKWILTSTTEPVFEAGKGLKYDNNTLMVTGFGFNSNTNITVHYVGWDGTKRVSKIYDTVMGSIGGFSNFLNNMFPGHTNVCSVRIFRRLTAAQKTQLVVIT